MSQIFNYMAEVVNDAKQHTDSIISNVSKSLIPYYINLDYSFIRNGKYRFDNETYVDSDHLVLKVEGLKDRSFYASGKKDSIYSMNVWSAIQAEKIHPFILFVNGKHINWSEMTIVRDTRYTYLLLPKNPFKDTESQILKIRSVKYIHIPVKTFYTESGQKPPTKSYNVFLRFNQNGELTDNGRIIYYLNYPTLEIKSYSFTDGNITNYDLGIKHEIQLTENNFFIFKDRYLDFSETVTVDRFNLFNMNAKEGNYKIFVLYRTDLNVPFNTIDKFANADLVKDISQGKVVNKTIDVSLLNKEFDFDLSEKKNYEQNIRSGFKYISTYDSDFIKKVYEMNTSVETKIFTGKEIRERCNVFGLLTMLLSKFKAKDTRVLIFCNGLLYHRYSEIVYFINTFQIPIDLKTLKDNDQFEFVFLKNINNYSEIIRYTQENKFKEQNPFEDDMLLLYTRTPKEHEYAGDVEFNERSWFEVPFTVDEQGNVIVDEFYDNTELLYTAKNQFKYCYRNIQKTTLKIRLTEDFMASLNPDQYLVFVNGRILNREFYRLVMPKVDNIFTDPYLYTRVKLNPGDKVEVIYGPIDFKSIDYSGNLVTKIVSMTVKKDQISVTIPYPFELYSYHYDFILFLNGVYVDPKRYVTQKSTLTFTDGTTILAGSQLNFTFIYDSSEEQEAYIYINNTNGIYMESVCIEVEEDGQLEFTLDEDKYIDYLMQGNSILVTYKGLYIPSEYWTLDRYNGKITFASNTFKKNEYIKVIIFHVPEELEKAEKLIQAEKETQELTNEMLTGYPIHYTIAMDYNDMLNKGMTYSVAKTLNFAIKFIQHKENLLYGNASKITQYHFNGTVNPGDILSWGSDLTVDKVIEKSKELLDQDRVISGLLDELPFTNKHSEPLWEVLEANTNGTLAKVLETYSNLLIANLCKQTILAETSYNADDKGVIAAQAKLVATENGQQVIENMTESTYPDPLSNLDDLTIFDKEQAKELASESVSRTVSAMNLGYFDISKYVQDEAPIFIMKNGTMLTEGYHYTLDSIENKVTFTKPLMKDEIVYLVSYKIKNHAVKSYEHVITIDDVNKRDYDLFDYFGDLYDTKSRFIIYMGSLVLDSNRYTVDSNCVLHFNDDVLFREGMHVTIICLYVDSFTGRSKANAVGSSKYHNIDHVDVVFEEDTYTYPIPYPNDDTSTEFIIMAGGILVDKSRYIINERDHTITFNQKNDLMFTNNTEFKFVFLSNETSHIHMESNTGEQMNESTRTYSIPVPYENYFEYGNNVLVFSNGVFMSEDRYTIDKENNLITLNEDEPLEGLLSYVFVYNNSTKNVANLDEDITISTIRKNGYIFMNKDKLDHPLSKSLVWLFMNGKKVSVDDITDISSNIIKINKDQQSRYNLLMLSHTKKIDEMDSFFKAYSNYDTLINNLSTNDLDQLFNTHKILSDFEPHYDMDINKDAFVTEIVRDWYGRTGFYGGDEFKRSYNDTTRSSDIQLDPYTNEYHSMVLDASNYFAVRLDRSNTNKDPVEE